MFFLFITKSEEEISAFRVRNRTQMCRFIYYSIDLSSVLDAVRGGRISPRSVSYSSKRVSARPESSTIILHPLIGGLSAKDALALERYETTPQRGDPASKQPLTLNPLLFSY